MARSESGLLDRFTDRFKPDRIVPRRKTREHPGDDAVREQIGGSCGFIGRDRHLRRPIGAPYAWSLDRQASTAKGHGSGLAAMAIGSSTRKVLAPRTGEALDLGRHQLVEDLEADRCRGCEQALAKMRREGGEMALESFGQLDRQGMDEPARPATRSAGRLLRAGPDVGRWHGFLQFDFPGLP